uniref:Uncharacterized protein n=2 Tax=Pygocentrus nattereri TaxID=42514 RepID=A0A3B4D1N5_PYGNA
MYMSSNNMWDGVSVVSVRMGCTSAKQVSAVPSDEEGRGKAYSNGDLFTDEYRMKGVEEVKYMRGEEDRVNARNQENLEKSSAHKTKLHKEVPGANANRANIHTSESQQEFFRMLDEKIEKVREGGNEELCVCVCVCVCGGRGW